MRRKLGLLCLALILAMGTLGVGYALWYEDLYIEGTVNTGTLDVEWSVFDYWDDEAKDVSDITAEVVGDTLVVTITNAYPCVNYWVWFDIHSTGTIPVHIGEFTLLYDDTPDALEWWVDWYGPSQLHQGEFGEGYMWFHFNNDAEELATYTFTIGVTAGQYNEFPIGGPFQGP